MSVTARQLDDLTQRIAYHLAKDYGLGERDFVIKYWPSKKFDYAIKSGGVIRVYFTHTPKYEDYETMLRRCLAQVALVKRDKRTGIVVYGGSGHPDSLGDEIKKYRQELPPLLSFEELSFRHLYRVEMKHAATGLIVVKEGAIGKRGVTVSKLMIDARIELSDLVNALLKSQREDLESVKEEPAVKSE